MTRPVLRLWRYIFLTPVLGVFGLGVLWILGLISFIMTVLVMGPTPPTYKADGIVVLTGGTERVETGLTLLKSYQGRELLISGVHKATTLQDLLIKTDMASKNIPCCITLGFQALDTAGNAAETAGWVKTHKISSLRLVTANYHMPRAYLEMRAALPDIRILPHPIHPQAFDLWSPSGLKLTLQEYHKTLLSGTRRIFRYARTLAHE